MKRYLYIAALLLAVWAMPSFAGADDSCLSQCKDEGHDNYYCKEKCNRKNNGAGAPSAPSASGETLPRVDENCLKECSTGYKQRSMCVQLCTYKQ